MENRHEIKDKEGRVWEECTRDEWRAAIFTLTIGDTRYRLKKVEPRTCVDCVDSVCGESVVYVPSDWPLGMKVQVTEVIE